MPTLTYFGDKDQPRARTGARGFTTAGSSVMLEPNVPLEITPELLKELEAMPVFKALKKNGAITVQTVEPIAQVQETDSNLTNPEIKKIK